MNKIDDGGPAFPMALHGQGDKPSTTWQDGMSLRDWLAGQALIGLLSADSHPDVKAGTELNRPDLRADAAYLLADAMLVSRQTVTDPPAHGRAADEQGS